MFYLFIFFYRGFEELERELERMELDLIAMMENRGY